MDNNKRMELLDRNKKIIQIIITEMERSCPDSIDLIGIGGSFCNGDYYEKSDLDLLIIRNNDNAKILEKTFILNDIGFDVYTQEWKDLEELSKYDTPYVTKLFELGIVYFKNQEVINKIKSIQRNLKLNMLNEKITKERAGNHFRNALEAFDHLEATENKTEAYLAFSKIIFCLIVLDILCPIWFIFPI